MSVFEALMLICFGTAWPFAVYRSWRSRSTGGKSALFLYVIFAGYVSGTIHKILYSFDPVIWLYVANGVMVAADIALYHRNRRIEVRGG